MRIGGSPAAIAGDGHTCLWPPPSGPHPKSVLLAGSATVRIGGKPAVRVGDQSACGAHVVTGMLNVSIG